MQYTNISSQHSSVEINLLALPARLGGLGLRAPSAISSESFQSSEHTPARLVALIISQDAYQTVHCATTSTIKKEIKKRNHQRQNEQAHNVYDQLAPELK